MVHLVDSEEEVETKLVMNPVWAKAKAPHSPIKQNTHNCQGPMEGSCTEDYETTFHQERSNTAAYAGWNLQWQRDDDWSPAIYRNHVEFIISAHYIWQPGLLNKAIHWFF